MYSTNLTLTNKLCLLIPQKQATGPPSTVKDSNSKILQTPSNFVLINHNNNIIIANSYRKPKHMIFSTEKVRIYFKNQH